MAGIHALDFDSPDDEPFVGYEFESHAAATYAQE
jgi:hypothetical protein